MPYESLVDETAVLEITRDTLPDLQKHQGHKYEHGHAIVVTGGPGKTGASRLAARGALRIGAGLVTLACPLRAQDEIAHHVTSIMAQSIDGPSGLGEMLEDGRYNALCLGPALGLTKTTADLVAVAMRSKRNTVLDADALMRFERAPEALFAQLHAGVVITPHEGEFRRLFPDLELGRGEQSDSERVAVVRAAAERAGCIVLLKGACTVLSHPDGTAAVHRAFEERATPWLATAGAGDVLAGFVTGLMARGHAPFVAAQAAVWLHVSCALHFGPGLIAEDLAEQLPEVLRAL